jgi:outer membrane biosynthesis protein TonB
MKRLLLAFAALASVSSCSESREKNLPVMDQPDRTLQVARPDTSDTAGIGLSSRGDEPVSPVEQHATRPEPVPKARPAVRKQVATRPKPKPPADTKPLADTSTRAYAPNPSADTVAPSAVAPVPDTGAAAPVDTARPTAPDSVATTAPDSTARRPDTSLTAASDTGTPARATDSTATAPVDTVSVDSALARSARSALSASSGFDDRAARTLPIGTEIHAALDDSISSRTDTAGRSITAQVTQSVTGSGGKVLIPAGSTVRFTVARLSSAKSKSSQGRFALSLEGIEVRGQLQKVEADVRPVPRELRGRKVTGSDAAKVGAGAAGGAVLGRVIGGNTKGAVIGGVVGAAGGAVVANQTATRDVVVKAKTPVTFVLTAPLVTP